VAEELAEREPAAEQAPAEARVAVAWPVERGPPDQQVRGIRRAMMVARICRASINPLI